MAVKESQLHTLCLDGSYRDIQRELLSPSANINSINNNGLTPLHVAVYRKDSVLELLELLELLYNHGANLNARTLYGGDTALHLVVRSIGLAKAEDIAIRLLQLGADPAINNKHYRTPADEALLRNYKFLTDLLSKKLDPFDAFEIKKLQLYQKDGEQFLESVRNGNDKKIESLIHKAIVNYVSPKTGAAAIHYCITHYPHDKAALLQRLTSAGADVNLLDHEKDSALNLTIKKDSLYENALMYKLAETLLKCGAKSRLKDLDGHDAYDIARRHQYEDIVTLLNQYSQNGDLGSTNMLRFFKAVYRGDLKEVEEALVLDGVNVNGSDTQGFYGLLLAVSRSTDTAEEKLSIVNCLLKHGANINVQQAKDGRSALHMTVESSDGILAQFLRLKGIQVDLKTQAGETALDMAKRLKRSKKLREIVGEQSSGCIVL